MKEYIKLKPGVTANTLMTTETWTKYAELRYADESPGEGWHEVAKGEKPPPEEGRILVWTYALDGDVMRKTYARIPPPRTFSKHYLYLAMAPLGLWDPLMNWLRLQTLPNGINGYIAFDTANELTDAHPLFAQWFAAAKTALGVDDATAEQILAAATAGGM